MVSFLSKLYDILENVDDDIISWSSDGTSIDIKSKERLTSEAMHVYFQHNNFPSFQRQLNYYGFQKVKRGKNRWIYANPKFVRGDKAAFLSIERKDFVRQKKSSGTKKRRRKIEDGADGVPAEEFSPDTCPPGASPPKAHSQVHPGIQLVVKTEGGQPKLQLVVKTEQVAEEGLVSGQKQQQVLSPAPHPLHHQQQPHAMLSLHLATVANILHGESGLGQQRQSPPLPPPSVEKQQQRYPYLSDTVSPTSYHVLYNSDTPVYSPTAASFTPPVPPSRILIRAQSAKDATEFGRQQRSQQQLLLQQQRPSCITDYPSSSAASAVEHFPRVRTSSNDSVSTFGSITTASSTSTSSSSNADDDTIVTPPPPTGELGGAAEGTWEAALPPQGHSELDLRGEEGGGVLESPQPYSKRDRWTSRGDRGGGGDGGCDAGDWDVCAGGGRGGGVVSAGSEATPTRGAVAG